jgi:hypothetical protein
MSKVIQIRGVPDDVHKKLVEAADKEGKSLTAYLAEELRHIASRADIVRHNREVILALRAELGPRPDDGGADTVKLIQEAREERTAEILRRSAGRHR